MDVGASDDGTAVVMVVGANEAGTAVVGSNEEGNAVVGANEDGTAVVMDFDLLSDDERGVVGEFVTECS